jgi:hypothetical protein
MLNEAERYVSGLADYHRRVPGQQMPEDLAQMAHAAFITGYTAGVASSKTCDSMTDALAELDALNPSPGAANKEGGT